MRPLISAVIRPVLESPAGVLENRRFRGEHFELMARPGVRGGRTAGLVDMAVIVGGKKKTQEFIFDAPSQDEAIQSIHCLITTLPAGLAADAPRNMTLYTDDAKNGYAEKTGGNEFSI